MAGDAAPRRSSNARRPSCASTPATNDSNQSGAGCATIAKRFPKTEWTSWLTTIDTAQRAVRCGITFETPLRLATPLPKPQLPSTAPLRCDLLEFVSAETAQLAEGERLPLMTEVLESCFGRLKFLEGDPQQRGFNALLLSLGALVGTGTPPRIAQALDRTPVKAIRHGGQTHLGLTPHTQRRLAYQAVEKGTSEPVTLG